MKKGQSRLLILLTFLYFGIVKHQSMEAKIEEIWKPVPGYEGVYEVSNMGRVKSYSRRNYQGRIMAQCLTGGKPKSMYLTVSLSRDNKRRNYFTHRLVATVFIGPPPAPKMTVDHKNNDKFDNAASNLQWMTRQDNSSKGWAYRRQPLLGNLKPEELSKEMVQRATRNEIVPIYVKILAEDTHPDQVVRINHLIINRWSAFALIYIKEKAWKIYDPTGEKFLTRK